MAYILISTQIRMDVGPTIVGDADSDEALMLSLNAEKMKEPGNNFYIWQTSDQPRIVLNKLADKGYRVIGMTGIGQTCAWTLYKS